MHRSDKGSNWNCKQMSIGELADRSGVSTRTLRHYESVGLLMPARSDNGYRTYSPADAKRLAQIQAMKLCGLPLATIRMLLADPKSNLHDALSDHLKNLYIQGKTLNDLIAHTTAAIEAIERIEKMDTMDAFEKMKAQGLQDFEDTYGTEARSLYGDDAIDAANERMMSLTQSEWDAKELLEESIKAQLRLAMEKGDAAGDEAKELARMHERWITIHWGQGYSKDAYLALVRGYLADKRFVKYYDSAAGDGATEFLVRAVESYQVQ